MRTRESLPEDSASEWMLFPVFLFRWIFLRSGLCWAPSFFTIKPQNKMHPKCRPVQVHTCPPHSVPGGQSQGSGQG